MMSFDLEYEDRIVAFIDVMGFKELLGKGEIFPNELRNYYSEASAVIEGKENLYNSTNADHEFRSMFFSDSIILSVKLSGDKTLDLERARIFFDTVAVLQYSLAVNALIWTRGAISLGKICMDKENNVLVGPAFVQAYELEKVADYPRMIVDPRFLSYFNKPAHRFVALINNQEKRKRLMAPNESAGADRSRWRGDAIMVNWFSFAAERPEPLADFFNDLFKRQSSRQDLFMKASRLLEYLQHSFYFMPPQDTDHWMKAHVRRNEISEHIRRVRGYSL